VGIAPGFWEEPTLDIFLGGSTAEPFVVCISEAARFEGTAWVVCEGNDERVACGVSFFCG